MIEKQLIKSFTRAKEPMEKRKDRYNSGAKRKTPKTLINTRFIRVAKI